MPEIVTMPPQFTSTERPYLLFFTAKQTLIIGIGILVAGATAVYLPLGIDAVGRAVLGLSLFLFFLVGGIGKYHSIPLLVYFGSLLTFRLTPKKYVKTTTKQTISVYPPTQNWLMIKETRDDIVVYKDKEGRYSTMLKIRPIDLDLRTSDAMDIVYSRMATAYNSFDFPLQIIISPTRYNPESYIRDWKDKQKQYPSDSVEDVHIQNHITAFKNMVHENDLMTRNFYICLPGRTREIAPNILKKEKEDIRAETDPKKKKEIQKKYAEKKYNRAAEELRTRKNIIITALRNIDQDLGVEELTEQTLIDALTECYGGGGVTHDDI